jgi:allantoicase
MALSSPLSPSLSLSHSDLPNLASAMLGTQIVFATDEWFAAAGIV